MGGVEGVGDREPGGLTAEGAEVVGDGLCGVGVAGDDRGVRGVEGSDVDACGVGEAFGDLGFGGLDGDHGAGGGRGLHEPASGGDQAGGVGEAEDACRVGGGELADGVAEQVVGAQAVLVRQQPVQGGFQGEQGRLGVLRLPEQFAFRGVVFGEQDVAQGMVEVGVQRGDDLVQGFGEGRFGPVQPAAHAGSLGALTGEHEGQPPGPHRPGHDLRAFLVGGERVQPPQEFRTVAAQDHGAMLQGGAGGQQRRTRGGEIQVRPVAGEGAQPGGLGSQRLA